MSKIIFSVLVAILTFVSVAKAGTEHYQLEQSIENKIRPIIQRYDESALVFVKADRKLDNVELPGTAVTLKNHQIESQENNIPFSKIEVRILTKQGEIPKAVKSMINLALTELGVKPTIIEEKLPAELSSRPLEVINNSGSQGSGVFSSPMLPIVVGSTVFMMIFYFLNSFMGRKHSTKLLDRFESSFKEAFTNLNSSADEKVEKIEAIDNTNSNRGNGFTHNSDKSEIKALPLSGFEALFIDCYWSTCDDYASFVWADANNEQKKHLIENYPFLKEYIKYISKVEQIDRGYASDAHYLSALDINHIDNEALTELVRKTPALFKIISTLRKENLYLTIEEQIAMSKHNLVAVPKVDFSKIPESSQRQVKAIEMVVIRDVNEEELIIQNQNLTTEEMELIPTLGWFKYLNTVQTQEILQKFSAKDLASAWVGPEPVLSELKKVMPEKKQKLLNDYLGSIKASRYSQAFKKLHKLCVDSIKDTKDNKNETQEMAA